MSSNKIMIFIDGPNLFHASKRLNIEIRYEKLMKLLRKDRNVIKTFYYSGVRTPITKNKEKFLKMLNHLEIKTITLPLKKRPDGSFEEKGVDLRLGIDLLWYAFQNAYDVAILVSGDRDYVPTVERVSLLGKRIELWSFKNSLSKKLKEVVDNNYYLDEKDILKN